MTGNLLTTLQLAELLCLKPQTLRAYVSSRKIPFTKIGASVRFTTEQVAEIIEKGKQEAIR